MYHRLMTRKVMTPPPLLSSTRLRLNEYFSSEVHQLAHLINKDLAIWQEEI
jgi:hypothetical protein